MCWVAGGFPAGAKAMPLVFIRHLLLACLLSPVFPFSLEEIWVVTVVLWLLGYPLYAHIRKREKGRTIIRREIEVLLAVYGWFYLGWGNNYYRQDFFRRSQTERVAYDEQQFRDF